MTTRVRRFRLPTAGIVGLVAVGVITAGLITFACGTAATEEVPLQNRYEAGDSWAHEMTVVMNGSVEGLDGDEPDDSSIPKDTTIRIRVDASVKELTDGVATVVFSYETLEATAGGKPFDPGDESPQEITVKLDRSGKVLSVAGLEGGGGQPGILGSTLPFDPTDFTNQFAVLFPEKGVGKVGDEWSDSSTLPLPGTGEDLTATTKARLSAISTENGRQMATIEYSVDVPMDITFDLGAWLRQMGEAMGGTDGETPAFKMTMSGGMQFEGTAKVDTADGRAVATGGVATLRFEMAITEAPEDLVPPDERGPFTLDLTITIKTDAVG